MKLLDMRNLLKSLSQFVFTVIYNDNKVARLLLAFWIVKQYNVIAKAMLFLLAIICNVQVD